MRVNVIGGNISDQEAQAYIERGISKFGSAALEEIDILIDGDEVELKYHLNQQPFERVRRITGYLVGTLDKWNNAKRSEEKDRVKHGVDI